MIIHADARHLPLSDNCVQCVVTSPPYWGLRDYGQADQIGVELSPHLYVGALVAVFAEVWRVLRDDGTVWLNLGDSYANDTKWGGSSGGKHAAALHGQTGIGRGKRNTGLKSKDLVGIPWRVAFALQAEGWYLRSDIIWHKPNPMPEAVTDRPTKSHEYLFLLTKSTRYAYDADAIREAHADNWHARASTWRDGNAKQQQRGATYHPFTDAARPFSNLPNPLGRNKRTVWTIPTKPYAGAHFATMPEDLVEPCILAGSRFGDLVLDPFLGSGTVGAVAERLSRRWVGTDLAYHPLAVQRTAQRGIRI
jgi:DNA modification methylase